MIIIKIMRETATFAHQRLLLMKYIKFATHSNGLIYFCVSNYKTMRFEFEWNGGVTHRLSPVLKKHILNRWANAYRGGGQEFIHRSFGSFETEMLYSPVYEAAM